MSVYALIRDGAVAELFTPPGSTTLAECFAAGVAAQFVDVTTLSPSPEPGWSATEMAGVWTFTAVVVSAPTLAQQAAAAMVGIAVASAGTPAVSRTYAMDPASRATLAEVVAGINAGDGFPGGGSTFTLIDPLGTVVFPSTAVFLAVAKALRDTFYALSLIANSAAGAAATLPAQPIPIA